MVLNTINDKLYLMNIYRELKTGSGPWVKKLNYQITLLVIFDKFIPIMVFFTSKFSQWSQELNV